MPSGRFITPKPINEKVRDYGPGSEDKRLLKQELKRQAENPVEVPIDHPRRRGPRRGRRALSPAPTTTRGSSAFTIRAGPDAAARAIRAATEAKTAWQRMPWEDRAAIFLKAADLLSGPYRYAINAATMLGQSKAVYQAEIDAACELTDYLRFNVAYVCRIYSGQPEASPREAGTSSSTGPLDGFVFAVAPFNFTSIGGNLPTAPAMLGNTVLWKPASTAVLSAHYFMKVLLAAGLPDGVINMIPGTGGEIADPIIDDRDLAGRPLYGIDGDIHVDLGARRREPRAGASTGIIRASSAKPAERTSSWPARTPTRTTLAVGLFRGAFEYQGQKCSAASRAYIPGSLWPDVLGRLTKMAGSARVGDVRDFRTFMGAVIDRAAYRQDRRLHRLRPGILGRGGRHRRRVRRQDGLLHPSDRYQDLGSEVPGYGGGDLRPRADRLRL